MSIWDLLKKNTKVLKDIGHMAGKHIALTKTSSYIEKLTVEYQVDAQLAQEANDAICNLLQCIITNTTMDKVYIKKQLRGPVMETTLSAIASSPHCEELSTVIQQKLSKENLTAITIFLQSIGKNEFAQELDIFVNSIDNIKNRLENRKARYDQGISNEDIPEVQAEEVRSYRKYEHHSNGIGKVHENMSDEEENDFIDSLQEGLKMDSLKTPADVLKVIQNFTVATSEVIKFTELQKTKRAEINARKEEAIHKIDAMRDAIKYYIDKTFDERSQIFAKQFECVDVALAKGDINMLALSLDSINKLAASSPFKNLTDLSQVQKQLNDNNTVWDI